MKKYRLWSNKAIKEIKMEIKKMPENLKETGGSLLSIIEEANARHNLAMKELQLEHALEIKEILKTKDIK